MIDDSDDEYKGPDGPTIHRSTRLRDGSCNFCNSTVGGDLHEPITVLSPCRGGLSVRFCEKCIKRLAELLNPPPRRRK